MANEQSRQNWTGGAVGWLDNDAVFDRLFAPVTAVLLEAVDVRPGCRLLEVGCGSGALLEQAVAQGAQAVGVDISPGMVEAAAQRVPRARVLLGDAQSLDLAAAAGLSGYDVITSRFGVMFFADPVAAFANLRRAAGDARGFLAFACWGPREENPMFTLGQRALVRHLEPRAQEPNAPGPTSLADPDRIRGVLLDSGWSSLHVERIGFGCDYGIGGSDGVEERLGTVLGTTTGRRAAEHLRPRLGESGWADLLDEVRSEIRDGLVDGTVRHPATAWLVTAG